MISYRDALFNVTIAGPGEDVHAVDSIEYEGHRELWVDCTGDGVDESQVTSGHAEDVTCEACISAREGL